MSATTEPTLDQTFIADGVTFSMLYTIRCGDTITIDGDERTVMGVEEATDITTHEREDGTTTLTGLRASLSDECETATLELNCNREIYLRDGEGSLLDSPDHIEVQDPHHRAMYARRRKFHFEPDTVESRETHSSLESLRALGEARQYVAETTTRTGTQVFDFFELDVRDGSPLDRETLRVVEDAGLEVEAVVDGAGPYGDSTDDGCTVILVFP